MAHVAKFAIDLVDGLSAPANKAKASIEQLSSSLKSAKSQLAGYKSQLSLANEMGDVAGHQKYAALVDSSKKSVFGLAQQLEGVTPQLGAGAAGAGEFAAALGPVGFAAGVAVVGLTALVAVTEQLVVKALEVTNANQKMAATFEALGQQGPGSGKKTLAMLDGLAEKLPQSREQLAQWTKQIEATGVTDLGKIRSELVATASAQAIMGDEGAAAYLKIQERVRLAVEAHHGLKLAEKSLKSLYAAGVNETQVAQAMGLTTQQLASKLKAGTIDAQKFGDALNSSVTSKGRGPLDVMMNSLDTLKLKGMEAIGHLFDGIDTGPLTEALRNVIALGDQGAPSGQALKAGFVPAMNAVIRMIGSAITEGEIFALRMEVFGLQAYIAFKPLIGVLEKIGSLMSSAGAAGAKVEAKTGLAPGSLGEGAIGGGKAVVEGFTGPLPGITGLFMDVVASLGNAKAQEVARAQGMLIGQATIGGMREGVQAHSPSVAAIRIGMDLGAGLGMGMERAPEPARAARTISGNALGGLAGGARGLGGAGANDNAKGGSIGPIHLHDQRLDGVTDAHAISVVGLSTVLERYQIGSGR